MNQIARLETLIAGTPEVAWSIAIDDLSGKTRLFAYNPLLTLKTASLAKIFLLIETAQRIETGQLDPDLLVHRDSVARVEDSGLWRHLRVKNLPLEDVAVLVAAVSDNWATNALLSIVGLDAVRQRSLSLGYAESRLLDFVRDVRTPDHPPTLSLGNAGEWVDLLSRLHAGTLVSPAVDAKVARWLATSFDHSMVAAPMRFDPLLHGMDQGEFVMLNKTGSDTGVRADAGIVTATRTCAYCAIANWSELDTCLDAVLDVMAAIGQVVRMTASPDPR